MFFVAVVFLVRKKSYVKKFRRFGNKLSKAAKKDKLKGVTR